MAQILETREGLTYDETRRNTMYNLGEHLKVMLWSLTGKEDIEIAYFKASDYQRQKLTEWTWNRLHLVEGDEYFIVYRDNGTDIEYLYSVNVTFDSYLTAADELLHLLAVKF